MSNSVVANDRSLLAAILCGMDNTSIKVTRKPSLDITIIEGISLGGMSIRFIAPGLYTLDECLSLIVEAKSNFQ